MVTLAEELFLLAHDSSSGKAKIGSTELDLGLAGALLLELSLAERVGVEDGRVRVIDPGPLGDSLLDAALAKIANEPRPRRPQSWVTRLKGGIRDAVCDRLVEAGVLGLTRHKAAGIFAVRRVPEADGTVKREVMARLHDVVVQGASPQPRTAALVSLTLACGMPGKLFPGADRGQVKRRMRQIAEGEWVGPAVKKSIDAVNAAIIAAVTASSGS